MTRALQLSCCTATSKACAGPWTQLGRRFDLLYCISTDLDLNPQSIKRELARFTKRVGTELRFKSFTYEELFRRLEAKNVERAYLTYLRARYFTNAA